MNRHAFAVVVLVYFGLCSGCRSQPDIRSLVDTLTAGGYGTVSDTLPVFDITNSLEKRFKRLGTSAIPFLIDAIDRNEKGWVGFKEEQSSTMTLNFGNFTGIKAAYMIEYLLSDSSNYQIYHLGVIARINTRQNRIYNELLTLDDVKKIKKIYRSWWGINKHKSMNELQQEWKDGKRVLDGTEYVWE